MISIIKKENVCKVLFAISSVLFVFAGKPGKIEAMLAPILFFAFLFFERKYTFDFEAIKDKKCIRTLPIICVVTILRCRKIYGFLNLSSICKKIMECAHLNGEIFGMQIGILLFTMVYYTVASYSLFCCVNLFVMPQMYIRKTYIKKENPALRHLKCQSGIGTVIALLLLAFIFTFSTSVCAPSVKGFSGGDFSIFYMVGKMWGEGYIPYIDIFDHKGPLIFLIYLVGITIHGSAGIYLLQTIALWASLCFVYKIVDNKCKFNIYGWIAVLGVLIFLASVGDYGYALTEEFCLPFLMASGYFATRYLKTYETVKEHHPLGACIYGISISAAFCMRITNAVAVAVWVAVIAILLLKNKEFSNLCHNIVAFIGGFCVVFIPFVIYFAHHEAAYDMMYGTIIYNVEYAGGGYIERRFISTDYKNMACMVGGSGC